MSYTNVTYLTKYKIQTASKNDLVREYISSTFKQHKTPGSKQKTINKTNFCIFKTGTSSQVLVACRFCFLSLFSPKPQVLMGKNRSLSKCSLISEEIKKELCKTKY